MSTALTKCTTYSFHSSIGHKMVQNIYPTTTREQFKKACEDNPGYSFDQGGRIGWNAICVAAGGDNVGIIEYIFENGGRLDLLSAGSDGVTALHCATSNNCYKASKKILDLGMPVNAITKSDTTSLWCSLEKTNSIAITKLLLFYGAVLQGPSLDAAQQQKLDQAKAEVAQEKNVVFQAIRFIELPTVLQSIIADYHLPLTYEKV